ncbi:SpvB-domain-containing protein [Cucurbitaria berberidis CBS 394.84]|uniref:SpvB-domain-containing protein n=1 Tax=Cucurbitaria berberidis CBS 394.84 TaxID=1168544 RepID=A0A9P4GFS0_9PLEO|nr:SpvB-domain-containing protein [Cucurbitaria berberidis CBS 394.84]KAF1844451.1 SpvB-domain-containing protein [Cucurbitaria berberidis CBS 394.84]
MWTWGSYSSAPATTRGMLTNSEPGSHEKYQHPTTSKLCMYHRLLNVLCPFRYSTETPRRSVSWKSPLVLRRKPMELLRTNTPLLPPSGQPRTRNNKESNPSASTQQTTAQAGPSSTDLRIASINASVLASGKGGGALRSIDQTFQVNPNTGALSLSIPLQVTASRNQCQPSVSLDYSSGFGNGPFGIGWSLSTETVARKTSKGVPRYDDADTFILSGHDDLVPLGKALDVIDGYVVQRFRPRVTVEQSSFRVESWTSQTDVNDVFWRTISHVNHVKVYGRTQESRVFDTTLSGHQRISSWLLCEVYDPLGNAMRLSYKPEDSAGIIGAGLETPNHELQRSNDTRKRARYIKSIKYGNRKPARDLKHWNISPVANDKEWLFEVVFDYGEHDLHLPTSRESQPWAVRRDPFSTSTSGFEVRTYRLCRRVLMFHHIEEELVLKDYLVSSYSFDYEESPYGSFLISATSHGHVWKPDADSGAYFTESLPENVFGYSKVTPLGNLTLQTMKPIAFQTLPVAQPGAAFRWIDLHGEGLQGILLQLDGAWYFQRNMNALSTAVDSDNEELPEAEDFGPFVKLGAHPNVTDYQDSFFEDIDGNGHQDLVIVDSEGRLDGYFECTDQNTWTPLQNFPASLNRGKKDAPLHRMDLTGNGRSDLFSPSQGNGEFVWYESLGKGGFTCEKRSRCPESFPQLETHDDQSLTYFADATGDGLTDILRLSNCKVSYWPNLGHGNFGSEVIMDNCPVFDSVDSFSTQRIRILDVDGSGTADLLYLLPTGGAIVYYNYCGNSWSDGVLVQNFPMVDKLSNVFTADLLGNGTSCLCWTGPQGDDGYTISFLNLGGDAKPHLLKSWSNGIGLSTAATYSPSTKFFLADERNGRPWSTKLPFPVHTVSRVVEKDEIVGSTRTTKFSYHDGYYDGFEREFCGFGEVDKREDERLPIADGAKMYKTPTRHTRLWYHTGAEQMGLAPISSTTFGKSRLQSNITQNLDADELLDAYRSLKGRELRTEVYGESASDRAMVPYSVEELSYDVLLIDASEHGNSPAIFDVHSREKLSFQYEQDKQNPRVAHELMLERNGYGDVTKSMHVQYGSMPNALIDPLTMAAQAVHHVTYTETTYTNDIDTAHIFYKPLTCAIKTFHASNNSLKGLFDIEILRKSDLAAVVGTAPESQETRTYYQSQDLSKRLDFGILEPFSVVDQQFQLAITQSTFSNVYNGKDNAIVGTSFTDLFSKQLGYSDIDADNRAWIPSNELLYGKHWAIIEKRLEEARSTFFVPTGSRDAFQNISTIEMDNYGLLPLQSEDSLGNINKAKNDYRVMQPSLVTDANQNRTQVTYNALGQRETLARMGKVGEAVGDLIEGAPLSQSGDQLLTFLATPSLDEATKLIGKAGSRSLYSRKPLLLDASKSSQLPTFRIDLTRTEHIGAVHTNDKTTSDIMLNVTYMDGRGRDIQHVSLTEWVDGKDRWCIHSRESFDGNGNAILTLHPYFSSTSHYTRLAGLQLTRTINFFDALDRRVGILNPDHSWSKIHQGPWYRTAYDAGDTVLIKDPSSDPDVGLFFCTLDTSLYSSSWLEMDARSESGPHIQAAKQSIAYANKPTTTYLDSQGKQIAVLEQGEGRTRTIRFENDVYGNQVAQYDALGRTVERTIYDLLGRLVSKNSMDAGLQIHLLDCLGSVVVDCNSRGIQRRSVYDALRRRIKTYVRERGASSEILWSKTIYGEMEVKAESKNLRGRIYTVSDQSGMRSNLEYDFKGNCIATAHTLAVEYKTVLDWNKTPAMHDKSHTTTSVFDALDRVISSTDAVGHSSVRKFDLLGRVRGLQSTTQTSGSSTTVHVTNAAYTADGKPLRIDYGNSAHSAYSYDERTRDMLNRRTWRDDKTVLEDVTNTYDCLGRLVTVTDAAHQRQFFRNCSVLPSRVYQYDDFGRLIYATGRETVDTGSGTGRSLRQVFSSSPLVQTALQSDSGDQLCGYVEKYTYDIADNILKVQHESSEASIAGWTREYSYSEPSLLEPKKTGNRLSSTQIGGVVDNYGYDEDAGKVGCITLMSGYSRLGWDINNKLRCSARQRVNDGTPQTTWYVYNENGARVRKVTEHEVIGDELGSTARLFKETVYLGSAEIYHTYDGDGKTVQTTTHTSKINGGSVQDHQVVASIEDYVLALEDSKRPKTPLIRYHINQNLEVDDTAQVISYEEYSPFGVSTLLTCRSNVEAPRHYRFAAYERDKETGLYTCGARYYASWLGRWLSPDPLGTVDGPNTYTYCANDPVNYVDPEGTTFKNLFKSKPKPKAEDKQPLLEAPTEPEARERVNGFSGDLPGVTDSTTLQQHLENSSKAETKALGLVKGFVQNSGGVKGIAQKVGFTGLKTAASAMPDFGITKGLVTAAENKVNEKQKEKDTKADRQMHTAKGFELGVKKATEAFQKELAKIAAQYEKDGNAQAQNDRVTSLSIHGLQGPNVVMSHGRVEEDRPVSEEESQQGEGSEPEESGASSEDEADRELDDHLGFLSGNSGRRDSAHSSDIIRPWR